MCWVYTDGWLASTSFPLLASVLLTGALIQSMVEISLAPTTSIACYVSSNRTISNGRFNYIDMLTPSFSCSFRNAAMSSDLRSRFDRQRQKRHVRSLRHRSGWKSQEADAHDAARTESCLERTLLLVSHEPSYSWGLIVNRISNW